MGMEPVRLRSAGAQNVSLGVVLTTILSLVYFGFVACCAFAPGLLARPVVSGGMVTWAFAYGLLVIVLGVVLTGLYVQVANRAESRRTVE